MSRFCKRDCVNCPYAGGVFGCSQIFIHVSGVPESGAEDFVSLVEEHLDGAGAFVFAGRRICMEERAEDADVLVHYIDSNRLEEGLMETTLLMDVGKRIVLVLGRYGELLDTGHSVDYATLSTLVGFPVVPSGMGPDSILSRIVSVAEDALWEPKHIQRRGTDEEEHARLGFVTGALQETLRHSNDNSNHTLAQRVDALLTNRWLGLPLMLLILMAVFELTFAVGAYPQAWIEGGVDSLAGWLRGTLPGGWLSSMLVDGVVQGVGAVLSFLPNIVIMFFFLSILEDSGYMSRAAYVMDKMMHRIGLHGNSFIPMLIGFGCNVPAIMAARSIPNRKDRTLTMLMIPYMSCSARLPVYMLFVSAFFEDHKALVMISIYVIGIVLAILFAAVMKRTEAFRQKALDYVSELPPFHMPRLKETGAHIWERVADYLQKITSVILLASVIIWGLEYFPLKDGQKAAQDESCLAEIGKWMEPATAPLGFDWKMNVCILTGLPAKEAIVSTMGILYRSGDDASLIEAMRKSGAFTPAGAIAFMLFVLLYFPCIATIATLKREAGRKWALFTVVHSLLLAWVVAFAAFRIFGLLL